VASDAPENPALCLQTKIGMSDTGVKYSNAGIPKAVTAQVGHTRLTMF
jgi:hypothetical protein